MTASYDPTTAPGQVRLLISDVGGADGSTFLFQDNEIAVFLNLKNQNIFYASALALRTAANNEVQSAKVIQFLDLKTDGEAVADVLNKLAASLEQMGDDEAIPVIAEQITEPFAWRKQIGLTW